MEANQIPKQLAFDLPSRPALGRSDFFISDCNSIAVKLMEDWSSWPNRQHILSGPAGSGKTHLAGIFESKYKAIRMQEKDLNNNIFKSLKLHENVILDNFENKSDEKILYSLFNLVDQDNKYLIINSNIPLTKMGFKLSDLSSRAKNCILAEIKDPDDDLIFALILKNFADMQIKVEKRLIDYIVKRIDRSYRKISNFIYKVDEISLKKKKSINLKIIKNLL